MKTIFTIGLLASGLVVLVFILDLLMYKNISDIFYKEIKPFKVTEETEIITLLLFALYFVVKGVNSFIKKKQNAASSPNKAKKNNP